MLTIEFTNPALAYKHLCRLAQLAGAQPLWIHGFNLEHNNLATRPYTGRK